jgi:O-antigen/teichoic acid export membrane protein
MEKFLKIYFWQFISVLLNFAALFVVTPYISSSPSIFGIYSIIIALSLFISYADFGFVAAGIKYASESFAKRDMVEEIRIIGFVGFIFGCFILVYALIVGLASLKPEIFVTGLDNADEIKIASNLLLILAFSAPIFVIQRILQVIFGIRLEDHLFQRALILANLLKISSVFFFFREGFYDIVGYFLWVQFCNAFAVLIGIYLARRYLKYDLILLLSAIKFDLNVYQKTSKLAFSSLFLTLCWIVFYEIDLFVIGKFLDTHQVAIYAIGLSILTLFRTLFGVIYNPFIPKFNYFIALNDNQGMRDFFIKVLILGLPVVAFIVVSVSATIKSFIFSWVGSSYSEAIDIARILVLGYVLSFISYPSGSLLMAYEKVRWLFLISSLLPVLYWSGVFITFHKFGLASFAYSKFISLTLSSLIYLIMICRLLKLSVADFLLKIIMPAIIPFVSLIAILFIINDFLPFEKSKINLLLYITSVGGCVFCAFLIYYFISKPCRTTVNTLVKSVKINLLSQK